MTASISPAPPARSRLIEVPIPQAGAARRAASGSSGRSGPAAKSGRNVRLAGGRGSGRGAPLKVIGPKVRRRPTAGLAAVGIVVLFAALFVNAIFHSVLVSGQSRLDDLNVGVSRSEVRNQQLRLDAAKLESPARIVRAATDAGMVRPDTVHWVIPQVAAVPPDATGTVGTGTGSGSSRDPGVTTSPAPDTGVGELAASAGSATSTPTNR